MSESTLHLSIDLAAELRKITQSQYLNRVHYLVQLVRHAVRHGPAAIRIESRRKSLSIRQDGRPFDDEEWLLLRWLLQPEGRSAEIQQAALARLEEACGVSILSLFFNVPRVEIHSAGRCLSGRAGRIGWTEVPAAEPGYRILIERARRSRREEREELEYFCAMATVPIYLNGRKINRPFQADGMLGVPFWFRLGRGVVGIPATGELSMFQFFKQGIRFGYKKFLPPDGRLLQGAWDSAEERFEAQFQRSSKSGEFCLRAFGPLPYRQVRTRFHRLPETQQARLKRILLNLPREEWYSQLRNVPLFHSGQGRFDLTLQDLLNLRDRFGAVPYRPRTDRDAPAGFPCLSPEEAYFVREKLGLPLQVLVRPR